MLKKIIALIIGHITVFKHAFKKPVTLEYPEVKQKLNESFRGKHLYNADKCKGCGLCLNACPANAITLEKGVDIDGKLFVKSFVIDYSKCIFCGNCTYYCKTNAIEMSNNYELATLTKEDLICMFKSEEGN